MDDENPPVRRFQLKTKEVEPVDKVARPGDGTAISVRLMHLQNNLAAGKPLQSPSDPDGPPLAAQDAQGAPPIFRQKDFVAIDPPAAADDENAISVQAILLRNRAAAYERSQRSSRCRYRGNPGGTGTSWWCYPAQPYRWHPRSSVQG